MISDEFGESWCSVGTTEPENVVGKREKAAETGEFLLLQDRTVPGDRRERVLEVRYLVPWKRSAVMETGQDLPDEGLQPFKAFRVFLGGQCLEKIGGVSAGSVPGDLVTDSVELE
jgi:hypothetical protein